MKIVTVLSVLVLLVANTQPFAYSQVATTGSAERFVELHDMTGEVKVKATPDANWRMAEAGMKLSENGEIKTGKDSTAVILIDEKGATGKVDVKQNTWMRIAQLAYDETNENKKTLLDIALGQVLVQAEKLKGESSFQVRTPTSTTSVRGTVFEVKVEEE